ncbi:MAG: galactose oxidase-like domain-containing protein [Gemmatimonadales bacterium]
MRRPRSSADQPLALVITLALVMLASACHDSPEPGAAPRPDVPADATQEDDSDQPIRLAYVCGNKFLVINAYSVPVSVSFRVSGTEEEGTTEIAAAPAEDPAFSEQLIETRNRGTLELYFGGRKLRTRENPGISCTPSTPAPAFLTTGSAEAGEWSAPFSWPVIAVHLSLLPSGKVLSWGRVGEPQLWDPATGAFTAIPSPIELFCAGHSLLSDGRLLAAGGHISNNHGLPDITLFSPASGSWSSSVPMQRGRWYPTNTTMSKGEVVITAGRDQSGITVTVPEVWSSSGLRRLTGASLKLPLYPRAFLAPNGKLFYAGELQTTRYLDIAGSGIWTTVGPRRYPNRDYGAAVMYDQGKILYAGGGLTTNTAETIDLLKATPTWQWTGSMAYARRHLNATVLPTGHVLVTGGTSGTSFNDLSQAVHAAEVWNPKTGVWSTLAANTAKRGYHATTILLPDGRVLHSGGGDAASAIDEKNAELFSPPYLFKGPRPTIAGAPTLVRYVTTFRVETPNAASITKVSLIRLGSATHAFDMNQRFQTLGFTADASGLTVTAPTNRKRTPPGHYLLFILNGSEVPSIARIVRVK